MNDSQTLRLAARRAALFAAVRSGDAIFAARAAARIRVPLAQLSAAELLRAREARRTLGRAIVKARLPRRDEQPLHTGIAIPEPRPGSRRRALLAALVVLGLLLLLVGNGGSSGSSGSPDQAAAEPQKEQTRQEQALIVSRGRTVALPPVIVAVAPSSTPAPTATATPAPEPTTARATAGTGTTVRTATPGPIGSGSGSGGTGGTGAGSGGSGGGSGSGSGGAGGGSGGGVGFPTAAPLPPVPPPGFGRFQIIVLDALTGKPVPGACVIIGTQSCDPSQPHTDANGMWAVDIPATTLTTYWDVYFSKPGYLFERRQLGLAAGQTVKFTILIRRG
ncbi:MAG TPA: hypothetical protein VGK15_05145 [Candidatus Limnocylindria bacterium]|jgi:hypothetical protein